jgi:hypothetical protein
VFWEGILTVMLKMLVKREFQPRRSKACEILRVKEIELVMMFDLSETIEAFIKSHSAIAQ